MIKIIDSNPAKPTASDLALSPLDLLTAIGLANYGEDPAAFGVEAKVATVTAPAVSPTLPIDIDVASAFLDSCMNSSPRVGYGLGAKIHPHGAQPGTGFTQVDCSGFVREAIWRATTPPFDFPDGSVVQHDWVRTKGFEQSSSDEAMTDDSIIRIAFLRPQDAPGPHHVGHVALVYNAQTLESHGSVGPDERPWTNSGWQASAFVFVLSR